MDVVSLRRRVGMVFQKSTPFPKSICAFARSPRIIAFFEFVGVTIRIVWDGFLSETAPALAEGARGPLAEGNKFQSGRG